MGIQRNDNNSNYRLWWNRSQKEEEKTTNKKKKKKKSVAREKLDFNNSHNMDASVFESHAYEYNSPEEKRD